MSSVFIKNERDENVHAEAHVVNVKPFDPYVMLNWKGKEMTFTLKEAMALHALLTELRLPKVR